MNCGEVALRLATYRDLDAYEQAEVQQHLRGCPSCRAMLEAFCEQDRLLQSLPEVPLSPAFADQVWARIHPRRAWTWAWQPVAVALVAVILLAGLVGGTVYASAGALPGDVLYPIKRINEQVQWTFALDEEARARLREGLAERRREEARQVLEQKRRVQWQFEGVLQGVGDAFWVVDGVDVHLCGEEPTLPPVEPGMQVRLDVESLGDRICLRGARVLRQPRPTSTEDLYPLRPPSPTASPTFPVASATPTPTPSGTPTVVGPQGAPGGRETQLPTPEPTRTPGHPQTPRVQRTPTPTEGPVRTPGHTLPPPTPTATATPTPTPTARPSPWATVQPATPQPTRTLPRPPVPTRRPTRTPRPWVTPPTPTPTPQEEPTATPTGASPRPTVRPPFPRTPRPTPTPTARPTKGPPPTPTPGVWDSPLPTPTRRR